MGFATFTTDQRLTLDGKGYRLVKRNSDDSWVLEGLDDRNVVVREERILKNLYRARQLKFIPADPDDLPLPHTQRLKLTPEERALIEMRKIFVRAVEGLPISEEIWKPVVRDAWKKLHSSKSVVYAGLTDPEQKRLFQKAWHKLLDSTSPVGWITVYRWAQRYYGSGDDEVALLDKNRGQRDRVDMYGSVVLGFCSLAIKEKYMTLERGTVKATWKSACGWVADEQRKVDEKRDALIDVQKENLEFKIPERIQLSIPPRRLIQRLIDEVPAFDKYAARFGFDAAVRRFRFVHGRDLPSEPLQDAQLDHTVLDLFVVDDVHWLPLGRPYITVCLDVYSRCVLGIYIGFTPPSGLSVANCLKDAFVPKDYYETLYPEIENEMPFGIPRRMTWDNGLEEHSEQAIQGCGRVGVRFITFCPRRKPWYKPEIERWFRTCNDGVIHWVPGTTFSNIFDKGDYNPEKFAVVRLSTFRLGLRKWIADVYHTEQHRVLGVAPIDAWRSGIHRDIQRIPHDPTFLDAILGRPEKRMLTHDGVHIHNLRFMSKDLEELRIRHGADLWVDLSVNEEDLSKIFVLWENGQVLEAQADAPAEYVNGLTLYQHKKFRERQRERGFSENPRGYLQAMEEVQLLFEAEFTGGSKPKGYARLIDTGESRPAVDGPAGAPQEHEVAIAPEVNSPDDLSPTKAPQKDFGSYLLEETA
jgi:putative transposase